MRKSLFCTFALMLAATSTFAQRPSIPPQAIAGPALDLVPVPLEKAFSMPDGQSFASVSAVAIDASGHVIVLHRGPQALLEFSAEGKLIRAFGEGLFRRSHGLRIDADGNYWTTDYSLAVVRELSPEGKVLLTLGTEGQAGAWDEAAGTELFDEPNDVAFDSKGNLYVVQGHGRADPRVLKFDRDRHFVKSWGGKGTLPGQFAVPHSIVIDENDLLYVADRENRRIQVFDTDGNFVKGWLYYGMACGLEIHGDSLYMTTGFDGQLVKLDKATGEVLGVIGMPGDGLGEYGEAHYAAVADDGTIYVTDTVNRTVQKYVPR